MAHSNHRPIDYKTHILVGVRADGAMTVIGDWPHVPRQAEVQRQIDAARNGYVCFALCTPTSILPGHGDAPAPHRPRSGRWA
jgi:hypothetical protein